MAYSEKLAVRVREALQSLSAVEEKKMFGGLAFLVNGKMCINVSQDRLMCRFDPARQAEIAQKKGYLPMIMRGKELKGYCYVAPEGMSTKKAFDCWVSICLEFNKNE